MGKRKDKSGKRRREEMKKRVNTLFVLLALSILSAGITVCASETETEKAEMMDYSMLGFRIKDPDSWEGLKGNLIVYPVSSTSINNDPELYAAFLYYIPTLPESLDDEEEAADLAKQMSVAGLLLTINGDREQLVEVLKKLGIQKDEETLETDLVQVGGKDGYQFFALISMDDAYADSLEEGYAEDYSNLPDLIVKELREGEYFAPVDPVKALEGKTLSFTSRDLDGNEVTSGELFGDNEITMVNLWGVWCINCVNEMEELAAINTRLQEKGCGIVGIEWEQDPGDETYQQARDLMNEKGTNYPSVLMPEGNEILGNISSYPATFFVDREGTILTKPIIGAKVNEYEPTVDSLLNGAAVQQTEAETEGSYTYRVFVKDEEDNPLEEAAVQFCDDTSCRMGETDEEGCAVFEVSEAKSYEVHIVEVPDGYDCDPDEVYNTEETPSDTTIVVKKAD